MGFKSAFLVAWAVLVGLSLVAIALGFVLEVGVGARAIAGAARRARMRSRLGDLSGAYPERTLAQLDEALERVALEANDGRAFSS